MHDNKYLIELRNIISLFTVVVPMGYPGCGKGGAGDELIKLNRHLVSRRETSSMFDHDITAKTARGLELLRIQAAGDMWPDVMVVERQLEVIHEEVVTNQRRVVILDGGLRTPPQAETLVATGLRIVAFTIELPPAECKARILAKPRMGRDGMPRPDDTPHGVDKRHRVYEAETAKVPAVLRARGINHFNINGWKDAAAKADEIAQILRIPRVETEDDGHRLAQMWRPPDLAFRQKSQQAAVAS